MFTNNLFDLMYRDFFGTGPMLPTGQQNSPKLNYPFNIEYYGDYLYYRIAAIGLEKGDIKIELDGRILTVQGKPSASPNQVQTVYNGLKRSDFGLQFTVPSDYDVSKITTTLDKGLLSIMIEKAAQAKPKQIFIDDGSAPPAITEEVD
jgi:HSP20 family molecular chaperone IbpA